MYVAVSLSVVKQTGTWARFSKNLVTNLRKTYAKKSDLRKTQEEHVIIKNCYENLI